MDGRSKSSFHHAFIICFLLMAAQAQALALDAHLCNPQHLPDSSRDHRSASRCRFSQARTTRDCKALENPRSLREEPEFGSGGSEAGHGGKDVSRGRTVHAHSQSSNSFTMLPHKTSDSAFHQAFHSPAAKSRRAILEPTPGREAMEALTTFKAGIRGGNLSIFDSWDVSDATPCGWVGVTCSTGSSSSSEQVTGLSLVGHRLEGSINSALLALGPLQSLERLDLSNNTFGSSLTGASLLNFSSLAFMNLSHNHLEGLIPRELGELTNLQSLALQFNTLAGSIPASLCNCTLLRELNLQENFFRGEIPRSIGRLVRLERLFLGSWVDREIDFYNRIGNSLRGGIPASLGNCSALSVLDFDLNTQLGGELPEELSQLHDLEVLSCIACVLDGSIPRWIGNLTNLTEIHLPYNNLEGAIPAEIGKLRNLSWLALGKGDRIHLSGHFPESIGNCTSLTRLRVSFTSITGIFPSSLANCSRLKDINLPNPLMDPAPIPSWSSSLTQLEYLSLPQSNRVGPIPSELGSLHKLVFLDLDDNALEGPIPSSLSNCTFLQGLGLVGNKLTGNLPFELGALSDLAYLQVAQNSLTGLIPSSIANLTLLTYLTIQENSFHGTVDPRFGHLQILQSLDLDHNRFVGPIPTTLGNCSDLTEVYLHHNYLTGEIPTSFGNLSQLLHLYVSHNDINGTIPVDLASCSALTTLDLSSNSLSGDFPHAIGRIPFLTSLNVSHNELTGAIANPLTNFSQIIWLDISYNQMGGRIPWESISNLQHMVCINVSHNFFFGSMSADWSNFIDIRDIDVSVNIFSGSIPKVDGLRALQRFDLSFNNFSGSIPESMALLPHIVFLNVSYNDLEGPVPDFEASRSNITAASFLGNPGLCGAVFGPSQECRENVSSSTAGEKCKLFQCTKIWIPFLAAGLASIIFILTVVTCFMKKSRKNFKKEKFDIQINLSSAFLTFSPIDVLAIIGDGENVIGTTSSNVIYKGSLPGHDDVIAIKRFVGHTHDKAAPGAEDLFRSVLEREANLHASLHHRNVLKLLSFCSHPKFEALLLEYMPKGSLHDHLYSRSNVHAGELEAGGDGISSSVQQCELPWSVRLSIAIDIAEGMMYLHHECPEPLIHGDLKPSNILLDDNMVAKVSDFGISRLVNLRGKTGELDDGEATASKFWGTVGYTPPEYAFLTTVSTKGDVFSYGILLLEMISGIPPTGDDSREEYYRDQNLRYFQESSLELLDPTLRCEAMMDTLKERQMMLVAKIALFATKENPLSRPSVKDIRSMLLQIKALEVEATTQRRTVDELAQDTDEVAEGCMGAAWESTEPNA